MARHDAQNGIRKNNRKQRPTNDSGFVYVHCEVAFPRYEANDEEGKCQNKKAEKWIQKPVSPKR